MPLLGWKVGIAANALGPITFSEAAGKTDQLGMAYVEGFSTQKVSPSIQKNLDPGLTAEDVAFVRNRLAELRLKMPAWHVTGLTADRKAFEFAKNLGVETIVASPDPASIAAIDQLASEFGISVAIEGGKDPTALLTSLSARGKHIGVAADLASLMPPNATPAEVLLPFKERLMALHIAGKASDTDFLREMTRLAVKPSMITVDPAGAESSELAFQIIIGARVEQICRDAAITSPDKLPQEIKAGIEQAVPTKASATPKKPRKLLILDENVNAYVHNTIPHGNYALQMMAKHTGAFEPVFSNDLNNLKYPKIKEFDAIFLNSAGGMIFVAPEIRESLLRYVREGGGLAGIHAASYASLEWPEFTDLIGAGDGPHHVEKVTLKVDDPASPLTAMLGGRDFVWVDEFYHFPPTGPYSRDKLHILFSIDAAKTDLTAWQVRPDNDYGMSWIKNYGRGRVFFCALGHTPLLFLTPAMSEHILAGIQFALGDLDADATPSARLAVENVK
jgi:type 1 glutamine amidotransferase